MIRWIYTIFITLLLPLAFLRLLWLGRKNPGYRQHWKERLGGTPFRFKECIWVHAVSLGETIAAEPLITRLLAQHPDTPIVLTSMTPTGRARASAFKHERVHACHLPYDLPWLIGRFIRKVHPKLLVLMETELWPNLIYVSRKKGVRIILANGRLSARSARRYGRIRSMTRQMFKQLSVVAAQTREDGGRFVNLGLPKDRLHITGSIKFDLSIPESVIEKAQSLKSMWKDRPVWIAASTHPNEEEQVLLAHRQVLNHIPHALLLLVPRHPERFVAVKSLCEQQGFTVLNRSSLASCSPDTQIYLGDTMGELLMYYASCDLAFVGGSLVNTGGHNLLEPAALGLPVLTGPNTFNFKEITRLLKRAGASMNVNSSDELAMAVLKLLQSPADRMAMGEKGLSTVAANRGALDKLVHIIKSQYDA